MLGRSLRVLCGGLMSLLRNTASSFLMSVSICQLILFVRLATLKAKHRMGFGVSPYREDGRENYIIALIGFPIGMAFRSAHCLDCVLVG